MLHHKEFRSFIYIFRFFYILFFYTPVRIREGKIPLFVLFRKPWQMEGSNASVAMAAVPWHEDKPNVVFYTNHVLLHVKFKTDNT
jgi:hypothetical protein